MTMPGDAQLGGIGWYETLLAYVHNGTVAESRIDDMGKMNSRGCEPILICFRQLLAFWLAGTC